MVFSYSSLDLYLRPSESSTRCSLSLKILRSCTSLWGVVSACKRVRGVACSMCAWTCVPEESRRKELKQISLQPTALFLLPLAELPYRAHLASLSSPQCLEINKLSEDPQSWTTLSLKAGAESPNSGTYILPTRYCMIAVLLLYLPSRSKATDDVANEVQGTRILNFSAPFVG